jgi:8-oxo-dGTP diphosphatase
MEAKTTKVTADAVIIREGKLLLVKRGIEPFKGFWALPGGHLNEDESVEEALVREAHEETGLQVEPLEIVGVYSKPGRDPRGHTVTIAYLCKLVGGSLEAGDDASEVNWFPLDSLPDLAFDHSEIIKDAKKAK